MVDLADNALTTLATVKTELGITGSGDDDTLKQYINVGSGIIEQYVDRPLHYVEDDEEEVAGYGGLFLAVRRYPLLAVSEIEYRDEVIGSDTYSIFAKGLDGRIKKSIGGWVWTAARFKSITDPLLPGTEDRLYTVTYTGGYVTPEQESLPTLPRTLPWEIEDAAIGYVTNRWLMKGVDGTITMEKLLSWTARYGGGERGSGAGGRNPFTQALKDMLNPYVRHYIP